MPIGFLAEKFALHSSTKHTECNVMEKQNEPCSAHSTLATPVLHAQLQRPHARNALQALSLAFADMAESRGCTKCMIKDAARTVTLCIRELRDAKKNGEWSKEEKKAMKHEVKATFNEIRQEVKRTWGNTN